MKAFQGVKENPLKLLDKKTRRWKPLSIKIQHAESGQSNSWSSWGVVIPHYFSESGGTIELLQLMENH